MVTELPNRSKIKNVSENNLNAKLIHCWNLSCNRLARNRMRHVKKETENKKKMKPLDWYYAPRLQ